MGNAEFVVRYMEMGNYETEAFETREVAVDFVTSIINSATIEDVQIYVRMPFEIKLTFI